MQYFDLQTLLKKDNYSTTDGFRIHLVKDKNLSSGFYLYKKTFKRFFYIFRKSTYVLVEKNENFLPDGTVSRNYIFNNMGEINKKIKEIA